ncbi:hypothetical protein BRYFOR_08009 [Marvinbryantia formatexigens DSM 14469]|uniref:Uncharacterized protein n=1 Tax=Marvinbryantia formatexigens DSM 14469 TaxID=478749 RepID=C6LH99_9FIRM|nr:hypothetical protein BRYFOR_08009 [Marvinbryantia formatexigens DSM 14469]
MQRYYKKSDGKQNAGSIRKRVRAEQTHKDGGFRKHGKLQTGIY